MNFKPFVFALAASAIFASCQPNGSGSVSLTNDTDSASYALGVLIGQSNKQNIEASPGAGDLNKDILINAFTKQLKGESTDITPAEARTMIQKYFSKIEKAEAAKNKKAGEEFLAKNKEKAGVITTASGLQYEVLKKGDGPKPTANQKVTVNYKGSLLDGTVFDSSEKTGKPASFRVNRVIKGWTEALQLMPVGSKWKLYIPSDLAYGPRGAGGKIGPDETLVFEVELLSIDKDKAPKKAKRK